MLRVKQYIMDFKEFSLDINGTPLIIKHSLLARQTNGAVLAKFGNSEVLAIAVMGIEDKFDKDCMPLSVDYEEKYYATGKLLGSRYMRRESRPSEGATLTSRMIDRTIRPLFNPYLRREVQVNVTCLAFDEVNDPDILAMISASIALMISDIPWNGPIGSVRIIHTPKSGFIINPTYLQREEEVNFEMVLSGVKNKINMIEFQGSEADEELIAQGFEIGQKVINQICDFQEAIQKEIGKEKTSLNFITIDETFKKRAYELLQAKQQEILFSQTMNKLTKQTEMTLLAKDVTEQLKSEGFDDDKLNTLTLIIEELTNDILHKEILQKDNRPDGRSLTEIRQLDVMIDVFESLRHPRGDTVT